MYIFLAFLPCIAVAIIGLGMVLYVGRTIPRANIPHANVVLVLVMLLLVVCIIGAALGVNLLHTARLL